MGFGSTLGGMGAAARGMGDAARDIAALQESQQRQDANALSLRQQQDRERQDRDFLANLKAQDWANAQLHQPITGQGPDTYASASDPQQGQASPQPAPSGENKALFRTGTNTAGGAVEAQQIYRRMKEADQAKLDALQAPQAIPGQYQNAAAAQAHQQKIAQLQENVAGYQRGYDAAGNVPPAQPTASVVKPLTVSEKAAAKSNPNVASFMQQYGPAAQQVGQRLGVDPNIILAQWGMETGWGRSVIPGTNNLGNIKDFSGKGTAAKDNATGSTDNYRQYADVNQFGNDFSSLVQRRYPGAVGAGNDVAKYTSGLSGYAEDPAYQSKIAAAYSMVQRAGGQPTAPQPGVPQTYAGPAPSGAQPQQYDVSGMPAIQGQGFADRAAQIRQQNFRLAQMQLQSARDYPTALAASQMIQKLQIEDQEAQLINLANSASGRSVPAMNALVGAFAQSSGVAAPRMVQTPNGGLALLDNTGRPIHAEASWGGMASWLHSHTSQSLQQKAAELSTLYKTKLAESSGTEDGKRGNELLKGQVRLEEARIHSQNQIDIAALRNNHEFNTMLTKHELTRDDVEGAQYSPDGRNMLVRTASGVITMPVPDTLKPGAVATQPQPTQVHRSAGLNPAMFNNNTIAGTPTR